MSLINEALKKAERERAVEQLAGTTPPMGGARSRVAKRSPPMKTQKILLIVAGALLLVVISAVLTGVFVTQKVAENKAPAKVAAAAPAVAPAAAPKPSPLPVIVARIPPPPVEPPPATYGASLPKPAAPPPMRAEAADPSMTLSNLTGYTPAAASAQPPGAAPAIPGASVQATATSGHHDPHVQALIDGFHVSGIRSAGNGSKVLMNDRVFRVNDIVDYGYGLKLVKVSEDTLTFVDGNGETYVKNF